MAATWTAPRTWNVGELVTKSIMDSHLRNNFDFLRTPPGASATLNADLSTTSTSFVDITSATATITTQGGKIMAFFYHTLSTASGVNENAFLRLMLDGTAVGATQHVVRANGVSSLADYVPVVLIASSGGALAAGSHTIKMQWRSSGGASISLPGASVANGRFIAVETWF